MEEYLLTAAAAFVAGAVSALLIIPKALSDRETHASNRILEMRLQALQNIWDRLNDLIYVVSPSMGMGYEKWHTIHYEEARDIALAFKKEVERQQVILDKSVIDAFKRTYSVFSIYMAGAEVDDRHKKPQPYSWFLHERLNPCLDEVADSINNTTNVSTHKISLQLTDEAV